MVAGSGTSAVAGVTGYLAGRRPDETMPFAYGKFESVGTLWVAVMLMVTACTLLYHLYEHFQVSTLFCEAVIWLLVFPHTCKHIYHFDRGQIQTKLNCSDQKSSLRFILLHLI